jgi:hypothetical protein
MDVVIWKFSIDLQQEQGVEIPKGAQVLTAQIQRSKISLWAKVDPHAPHILMTVLVLATGQDCDEKTFKEMRYLSTVQSNQGEFVWHVFIDDQF